MRQGGGLGQPEEHEQRSLDERDRDDLDECQRSDSERQRKAAERERTSGLRDEHHALPVPAVDERAGGKVEQHEGQRLREADDPRLCRRMRERQDEQRIRDAGDARPQRRDDLSRPEQDEVAVPPQRRRFCRCGARLR